MFLRKIEKIRKQNKLTQQEFGELIGVGGSAVSKWETGAAYPTRNNKKKIQQFLKDVEGLTPPVIDIPNDQQILQEVTVSTVKVLPENETYWVELGAECIYVVASSAQEALSKALGYATKSGLEFDRVGCHKSDTIVLT